jgi:hypothetical protein
MRAGKGNPAAEGHAAERQAMPATPPRPSATGNLLTPGDEAERRSAARQAPEYGLCASSVW